MNALAHQTRIAVNVIVDDDTGSVTEFLTALTALIGLLLLVATTVKPVFILPATCWPPPILPSRCWPSA